LTPHDNHHPSRIMRNYPHILVYLWGLLLAGRMTEKEITSLCNLSTFAWIFPTFSAVHFLASAFLAITFWSKECVITGIEGLAYELRICDKCDWHTAQDEEHILLDCPHGHLASLRKQHRQLVFPPQNEDSPTRLMSFWTNQMCIVLPLFWLSALFP